MDYEKIIIILILIIFFAAIYYFKTSLFFSLGWSLPSHLAHLCVCVCVNALQNKSYNITLSFVSGSAQMIYEY